jgi:hypothetical protein
MMVGSALIKNSSKNKAHDSWNILLAASSISEVIPINSSTILVLTATNVSLFTDVVVVVGTFVTSVGSNVGKKLGAIVGCSVTTMPLLGVIVGSSVRSSIVGISVGPTVGSSVGPSVSVIGISVGVIVLQNIKSRSK